LPYGAALKLLALTGCRREEIAGMRRGELSADLSTWTIPSTRAKNHREHVVPLPPLARAIIAELPANGDLVFSTNGAAPIAAWSRIKRKLDRAMKLKQPWVVHDLRRSFVTGMGELGIRPDVIELCVNHVSGARANIAGVYNRSELLPERTAALQRWADHVAGLAAGRQAAVVPLRRGA
jgi:integrase